MIDSIIIVTCKIKSPMCPFYTPAFIPVLGLELPGVGKAERMEVVAVQRGAQVHD